MYLKISLMAKTLPKLFQQKVEYGATSHYHEKKQMPLLQRLPRRRQHPGRQPLD
jgi:hypothetical protein